METAYQSLRTVGDLLLTNSDFRIFLQELGGVGRQVFADTAFSVSNVAEEAGQKIKPDSKDPPPLENDVADISKTVEDGIAKTGHDAAESLQTNLAENRQTLLSRLKSAVVNLRQRTDYSESVSTIATLIKRYALVYSRAAEETVNAAEQDVETSPELDRAVKNFWALLSSFGDRKEWDLLEEKCRKVLEHSHRDPDFENLMVDVGNSVQKLLSDPDFFDSAEDKINKLREKSKEVGSESSLRKDIDSALSQFQITFKSALNDPDISKLITSSMKIFNILSPVHAAQNPELVQDFLHIFIPLLIQAIQYIPILRLEISVPEIDLLLENLIIEPGRTVRNTSFLPYKLRVETQNDLEIRKTHTHRTVSTVTSLLTVSVQGLSLRADEVGFWFRAHSGLLRLADEGIMSLKLDERGIDVAVDVEIGRERVEKMLSLRKVRVNVHRLDYTVRQSKFAWLAWLVKPLLRPIMRRVLERQLATALADLFKAANRELLFFRERLRATRISDPQDLRTFVKAVITRLTPAEDPDLYTSVGVRPSGGVFRGVYAPGSVVKLFEDEARRAGMKIDDGDVGGWRNEVFDVQTQPADV